MWGQEGHKVCFGISSEWGLAEVAVFLGRGKVKDLNGMIILSV